MILSLPLRGRVRAVNSPARRVPSHGTSRFGTAHAIDLVPVDARGLSGPLSWRTLLATEPAERFVGFGQPVLAPASGVVVGAHDGEPDHEVFRSPVAGLRYLATQGERAAAGFGALAGNHVVIESEGAYVTVCHLRRGSLRVRPGARVAAGEQLGECGNSGNSTEPHVHLQVNAGAPGPDAVAVPFRLRLPDGVRLPRENEIVAT